MKLVDVYDGWVKYNDAILEAFDQMSPDQFGFAILPDGATPAHLFRHIALGRIEWLVRIGAPGFDNLAARIPEWKTLPDGVRYVIAESVALDAPGLRELLCDTAIAIQMTLQSWDICSLGETHRHPFRGTTYAISKQWTLMRILMHDVHHGGQLSLICQQMGIDAPKLVWLGGHLPEPAVWDSD